MKTFIKIIKEHWEYRHQILKLAKSDVIKTYRGSALGWSWAVIKPTITIFVYWFAFAIGLRNNKPINGYDFFLWLIAGVVPWFYMGDMIVAGTKSIRKYSYLVTKMKFPVSTIPTFVSMANMFINMLLLLVVIGIFWLFGYPPDIYYLQIPLFIFLSFVFFTLWSLFSAFLGAISKDFVNLIKSLITAVFWLSGILWNADTVEIPWLRSFLNLNPVTFLVNGFRNCFINKMWFWQQPKRFMYFIVITIVLLILGIWAYKKLRKDIADVL